MSRENTVAKLLRATQEVIAEEGILAATTRNIANRAGVLPGVVHYHAGSVEALRRLAITAGVEAFFREAMQTSGDGGVIERLFHGVASIAPDDLRSRLLLASLGAASHDAALRQEIATQLGQFREWLEAQLQEEGFAKAADHAQLISIALDGFIVQRTLDPGLDAGRIAQYLADMVL